MGGRLALEGRKILISLKIFLWHIIVHVLQNLLHLPASLLKKACMILWYILNILQENKFYFLGEHPFQVCFYNTARRRQKCSGSIIEPNYVLTAKHCLENKKLSELVVCFNFKSFLYHIYFNRRIYYWLQFSMHLKVCT